ncbi:MAG: Rpn family recombination-promoting nuclease/putative transposase [Legionellales bacterium]|nr:Rpn family recombination-promoting nuclease/putative transposase [Legionellales bacterium]
MSRYLDPKADVVFKKIFGLHPRLLISFLNAVLPLPDDGMIESLIYLPSEQVPHIPGFKSTLVDVKCTDQQGRIFIVEMQIQWTKSFMQRLLFGTSTAYVQQLEKGEEYHLLRPVYGLGLLASKFDNETAEWYHHYQLVNVKATQRTIEDLQLIFIELPKFSPATVSHKKLQVLWLRFMRDLNDKTKVIPSDWLEVSEIKEAVALSEAAAYNEVEMAAYNKYWDAVSTEKTMLYDKFEEGKAEGKAEGIHSLLQAVELLKKGQSLNEVSKTTGLDIETLELLSKQVIF